MKISLPTFNAGLLTVLLCLTGCDLNQQTEVYGGEHFCIYGKTVSGTVISKPSADYVRHDVNFNGTRVYIFEGGGIGEINGQKFTSRNGWVWTFGQDGPDQAPFAFFRHRMARNWPRQIQVEIRLEDVDKINKEDLMNAFEARTAGESCPLSRETGK